MSSPFELSELDDCAVGIDATYYLGQLLDTTPAHEPLLSALGGLTGINTHINQNLDLWKKNNIIPFFIFDGQSITGQDEVSLKRGRNANAKTDEAWNLYSQSSAEQAVNTFGANPGTHTGRRIAQHRLTRLRRIPSPEPLPSFASDSKRAQTSLSCRSLQCERPGTPDLLDIPATTNDV